MACQTFDPGEEDFRFIFDNVIFPPRLPQEGSPDEWKNEKSLLSFVTATAQLFVGQCPEKTRERWHSVVVMLYNLQRITKEGVLCEDALRDVLGGLHSSGPMACLIRAQNCGLIMQYDKQSAAIIVDAFEASPGDANILNAKDRLVRQFPERSVRIPYETTNKPEFLQYLARELARLSAEQVDAMMPQTRKAGQDVTEQRDTAYPWLVTENLMNQLLAIGSHNGSTSFIKHTHDDVNWSRCELPWRRSPFWLVLRVALQTLLRREFEPEQGQREYKNFMIYLISRVGDIGLKSAIRLTPDILSLISTKVGRRVSKLQTDMADFVITSAHSLVNRIRSQLERMRHEEDNFVVPCFPTKASRDDIAMSLGHSRDYISNLMTSSPKISKDDYVLTPGRKRRIFGEGHLPDLSKGDDYLAMAEFENWVERCLDDWVSKAEASDTNVGKLGVLFKIYLGLGQKEYRSSSRERSLMFLVLLELWMAMDKLCIRLYPLLERYRPPLPENFLEPLLLPQYRQMQRAGIVESYISQRRFKAGPSYPDILSDPGPDTFGALFFDGSKQHQELRKTIEQQATVQREKKEAEWRSKSEKYEQLQLEISRTPHDYVYTACKRRHVGSCKKCSLDNQAAQLSISVHEWPLSTDISILKATIFELDCPRAFVDWRDISWRLIQDLGRQKFNNLNMVKCECCLLQYSELQNYGVDHGQRLGLGSTTKSWLKTHYRPITFPVPLSRVCCKNALNLKLWDKVNSAWIHDQTSCPTLKPRLRPEITSPLYSSLEFAVESSSHSQNKVLADQTSCHAQLSLDEFIAFGSLRAGEGTQWYNITRELAAPNLTLNEESVAILLRQAAWELGSLYPGSDRRLAHKVFEDAQFSIRLLEVMASRLNSIRANWKEQETLTILVTLALRVLSLTTNDGVIENAVQILRDARKVAFSWCEELLTLLDSTEDSDTSPYRLSLIRASNTCQQTYDVESKHLEHLLVSPSDTEHLIHSSIVAYGNSPGEPVEERLLRGRKILYAVEGRLRELIRSDPSGIDSAIGRSIEGATLVGSWEFVDINSEIAYKTLPQDIETCQRIIRYDLLSGELLINGHPPGRLPAAYTNNDLYRQLFDSAVLTVVPSDLPGSVYAAAKKFGDCEVHFGVENGEHHIRARSPEGLLQLVPKRKFNGDFPTAFIDDYCHWLNAKTGVVEFCPISSKWKSSTNNWRLTIDLSSPQGCLMQLRGKTLIDIHSGLSRQIIPVLQRLDRPECIHISVSEKGVVEAELVRLRLKIFVNHEGLLECRELSAIVDPNQDIGCLYGFASKLAMKSIRGKGAADRSVVIPYHKGGIEITSGSACAHTAVSLPPRDADVKYFRYWLNEHLRTLEGPNDMLASLYQCYLHAITGYVLPDPFTGRLGTDEALRGLRQSYFRTSAPLGEDCVSLLNQIRALTPKRYFYPRYLKVMQTVIWNSKLNQLTQHDDFRVVASEIMQHALRFAPFNAGLSPDENVLGSNGDSALLDRARVVNSRWRYTGFGGAEAPVRESITYTGRHQDYASKRGRQVYEIAALIRDWPSEVNHAEFLNEAANWQTVFAEYLDGTCNNEYYLLIENAFGTLYDFCRYASREADSYKLMSRFCMITYGGRNDAKLIRTFLAIAFSGKCRDFPIPSREAQELQLHYPFTLSDGEDLNSTKVRSALNGCRVPFQAEDVTFDTEEEAKEMEKVKKQHDLEQQIALEACYRQVASQWPSATPVLREVPEIRHVNLTKASTLCCQLFRIWYSNRLFMEDLRKLQQMLHYHQTAEVQQWRQPPHSQIKTTSHSEACPTLEQLMTMNAPSEHCSPLEPSPGSKAVSSKHEVLSDNTEIHLLISHFEQKYTDPSWKSYIGNLAQSLAALEKTKLRSVPSSIPIERHVLVEYRAYLNRQRDKILSEADVLLPKPDNPLQIVVNSLLWPSITVNTLLSLLSRCKFAQLSVKWRNTLVSLGIAISEIQRCERLLSCLDRNDVLSFFGEAENCGRQGWDPMEEPDWLLLEVENNLTIRKKQAEVAHQMISPDVKENIVLQLNMGEGKTSVITPMVVSKLADGKRLVRVIVLKPLLRQSINLLSYRLGKLINRPIYHVPFARSTPINSEMVSSLWKIYQECKQGQGIVVALPEHILSFRLIGMDLCDKDPRISQQVLELEHTLLRDSRDVIDESDEVLHTQFQLVYTMGNQKIVDGGADRWGVAQKVFRLVEEHAYDADSCDMDVERHSIGFPKMRFLRPEAVQRLLAKVLLSIEKGRLPGIPFNQWRSRVRESALRFVCSLTITEDDILAVTETFGGNVNFNKLLILRGLFAHGILAFALQNKRWRVDYGIHPTRCMMAVPFRAKDVPSENSEFGHPDVAILLTCLAYYYKGLSNMQISSCFTLLSKENDGATEYQNWIARAQEQLPVGLRNLTGVNTEDTQSIEHILFPHLRFQKSLIDFYLSRVVFPREAKQFATRLSTSAWDLPSRSESQLTTGFSGTNDNRSMLPLSIKQNDLPRNLPTNAMVIRTLLQQENRSCISANDDSGRQLGTRSLLKLVRTLSPSVQVLIDVGAQVLELGNHQVAKEWLKITPDAEAVIYFDDRDEEMVVDRQGHVERLRASSFQERLGNCLVYLDQYHSRGVDLKLPTNFRAAVTLGPKLTKDRLVQACNRMRKLGDGQTVIFLSPPQVSNKIRELANKSESQELDSADVIRWTLVETCEAMEALRPLWAHQGLDYCRRWRLWQLLKGYENPGDLINDMQEPEAKSLKEIYGPKLQSHTQFEKEFENLDLDDSVARKLQETWKSFNLGDTVGYLLHEEQEREIACEVERECQIERPPNAEPVPHYLHPDLRYYVARGVFPRGQDSTPFISAFKGFDLTTVRKVLLPNLFPELVTTEDFKRTIKPRHHGEDQDEFVKPVNWILSSAHNDCLVIISQFEANELLPDLEVSSNTKLHVFCPRVTKAMISFRDLDFLHFKKQPVEKEKLAMLPIKALELFSGNLYFNSFNHYREFCSFLGLLSDQDINLDQVSVSADGFVDAKGREQLQWPVPCSFETNPLPLVNAITVMQRRGQAFKQSHLGQIVDRMGLTKHDFPGIA